MELKDTDTLTQERIPKVKIPTQKVVQTTKGEYAVVDPEVEGFDFKSWDDAKSYDPNDKLPLPIIKTNSKGIRYLEKAGEPRFMFRGNDLLRIQRGLNGKKTVLLWKYKDKLPIHQKLRAYLRKKGIMGA